MPRLWSETIESHRQEVHAAILEATATVAAERGPMNVTMSQVADRTGIARATLYKYFASVEEILKAWHQRRVDEHLRVLTAAAAQPRPALDRLRAVLDTYVQVQRHRATDERSHDSALVTFLHRPDELSTATERIRSLLTDVIADAADAGEVRTDVSAAELADYCFHAIGAAQAASTDTTARRLLTLIIDGLRPTP